MCCNVHRVSSCFILFHLQVCVHRVLQSVSTWACVCQVECANPLGLIYHLSSTNIQVVPSRHALWELLPKWYQTFPPDDIDLAEMNEATHTGMTMKPRL